MVSSETVTKTMNPTNCSLGLATDTCFLLGNSGAVCQTSLVVYDSVISLLLLFRFITMIANWEKWLTKRAKNIKKTDALPANVMQRMEWERRIPFIPLEGTFVFLGWLIFFVLVRVDAISSRNGGTFFFWCLQFLGYAIYSFHFQRKMVHLGRRIFPLMRKNILGNEEFSKDWAFLEHFDSVLIFFQVVQIVCTFTQTGSQVSVSGSVSGQCGAINSANIV